MTERQTEYVVGSFVVTGLLAVTVLALYVGGGHILGSNTQEFAASFTNVSGLKPGARVVVAGVRVGQVTSIELDRDQLTARVGLAVDGDLPVYDDAIASIRTAGLIGEKFIALSPGGGGDRVTDGFVIVDTESSIDLENILGRVAFGGTSSGSSPSSTP